MQYDTVHQDLHFQVLLCTVSEDKVQYEHKDYLHKD